MRQIRDQLLIEEFVHGPGEFMRHSINDDRVEKETHIVHTPKIIRRITAQETGRRIETAELKEWREQRLLRQEKHRQARIMHIRLVVDGKYALLGIVIVRTVQLIEPGAIRIRLK